MNDFLINGGIPMFICFILVLLIEPFVINVLYFSNIDLFLDLILTKKKRFKLIKHILENYSIDNNKEVINNECYNHRR